MPMQLSPIEIRSRYEDFPTPIRVIGQNVPVVRMVLDLYAHGQIVTREEALCQMIVELSKVSNQAEIKMMELAAKGIFVP